ncbi:hypothetical protein HU200_006007 [Digitaria exilis]|uniref:External alternative NADH-ubiquinone oxidoreductase-like C-terminal domain-containing protein n=1 Tax=Digitaria exilis TaxID=1010633 RepID=A0A835FTB5_9POAL|nr:hypothetical protein HU200_006007 [Digitaria exilis]
MPSLSRYKHLGQFAPLGGEQAAAELPGDWVSMGHSTQWLWYSVYASKQVSWAHKDAGGFRLDSQVHIREGFKPNLAPLARPNAQLFLYRGIMLNND